MSCHSWRPVTRSFAKPAFHITFIRFQLNRHSCSTFTLAAGSERRPSSARKNSISTGTLRSEEHTSELQSLMRRSYAVFSLTKKTQHLITFQIIKTNHLP